ncbi:hypothetical protein HWV62_3358 [Athelia sp. TMB]|nr:hypothetical protein HWV62_3358 [Athelia sp. TMB]
MLNIPQDLIDLALKPLPTSSLFHSTLHGRDTVDETDLDQWDHPPPYSNSQTPSSDTYAMNLVDVVHGRRLRAHLQDQRHRMEGYRSRKTIRGVHQATLALERQVFEGWARAKEQTTGAACGTSHLEGLMGKHYLQWTARWTYSLHEEVQALAKGREAYETLFNSRFNT